MLRSPFKTAHNKDQTPKLIDNTVPNPQNWAQRNKLYLQMNLSFNLLHFSYTNTPQLKTFDILIKTFTFFIYIYYIYQKTL